MNTERHPTTRAPGEQGPSGPSSPYGPPASGIEIPDALAASHARYFGEVGRAWTAGLPDLAADFMERWRLRADGPSFHGVVALVLPVICADGTPAALKLQLVEEETLGEPVALRAWDGNGSVRLLCDSTESGAMLLERLNPSRSLSAVQDDLAALQILSELLARLVALPAPEGLRRLADVTAAMLDHVPWAQARLADPGDRRLLDTCAGAVRELLGEPGDRLLHWDLHYDNVLASHPSSSGREPWLAIDPKPLAGDPGFELLPALDNRWDEIVSRGDVARAVLRRFDLMTEVLGLDRRRAVGWTLGRVLQNALWDVEDGEGAIRPEQKAIAAALLARPGSP
ncbi:aminoglycoside phosphotransferase family protein [Microtetraspora sp. NBRC 16547]|uniref:aminoglycoside phosphotransferase family protein n=1 Tax=Microtetraspora sp. NBRC 16547 TaxID=3030993 RepID=UPI0024A05FC9|nr:aminoglycoside phosphotransferase family protein [Microtetraspora sp. NBRC 16547]GLX01901.1 hydroxyurea phosphotransferase [Microtetraspora sp. NBRC 16547]